MAFFVIVAAFCAMYVVALAAPWQPGYPILEEPLMGCPCKVNLGGSVPLPTKIVVKFIPMVKYRTSVAEGRLPIIRPRDYTVRSGDYCEQEDVSEAGDFMMVVYSYRPGLFVRLLSVTRPNEVCEIDESDNNSEQPESTSTKVAASARIAHGTVVTDEQIAKYNVLFEDSEKGAFTCSGSLISARWVLTAAHCREHERDKVIVGKYLDFQGEVHYVEKVITHENFSDEINQRRRYKDIRRELNDIALVLLKTPVKDWESKAIKVNARPEPHLKGDPGIVSGYGQACAGSERFEVLRKANVSVTSYEHCKKILEEENEHEIGRGLDREQHICAYSRCGGGACKGDSGGPLVEIRNGELVQIGITSYHPGTCGEREYPDIYTRVAHYAKWIHRNTKGEVVPVR